MARQAPEPVTATLPADLLRAVLERARSLIVGVRPDGTWFPLSQTVPELLGGATDDRALVRLVHPEDQAAAQRLYDQASARERVTDPADLRVRSASGRWITLETVAAGLLGDPRAGVVVFYGR
ncbi:MAG: hypothetical protein QOI35_1288, partial [Cryptosporangiaceae bacterium]|nr:hypothetical protein [Cryptosporangiaceae bacterium]